MLYVTDCFETTSVKLCTSLQLQSLFLFLWSWALFFIVAALFTWRFWQSTNPCKCQRERGGGGTGCLPIIPPTLHPPYLLTFLPPSSLSAYVCTYMVFCVTFISYQLPSCPQWVPSSCFLCSRKKLCLWRLHFKLPLPYHCHKYHGTAS